LWQSTGCWSIRLEISRTICSSGSGSGPVTRQRVTGRTDAQTKWIYIRLKTKDILLCSWI
jgi:hypothetical protein